MFSRQRLFWSWDPYGLEGTQERFVQAVADNCAWHIRRCPEYRAIAEGLGFSPKTLVETGNLSLVPMLPTLFFKRHALFSMPKWRMGMKVTSSGTSGRFSRVGFDWGPCLRRSPWC